MKYIKNADEFKDRFLKFCIYIEKKYPMIQFYGGRCTGTWELIYQFQHEPKMNKIGLHSSVTSLFVIKKKWLKVIDDWCPHLYAK